MNLFLDDCRTLEEAHNFTLNPIYKNWKWSIVRSYDEFVTFIETNGLPEFISFDHDLADEHYAPKEFWDDKYNDWAAGQNFKEKTGLECAKWLVDYCMDNELDLPDYYIHSANPVGAKNIYDYFESYLNAKERGII
jgi:hypothetical protein